MVHSPAVLRVINVTLGPSGQRSGELIVNEVPVLQTPSTQTIHISFGLRSEGRQPLSAVPHSSDKPAELSHMTVP